MALVTQQFSKIWRYRWQIWVDLRKEMLADTRQTFGHFVWVVLVPMVPILLYWFIASLRVFRAHDRIAPIPYVIVGATFWFLFSGLLTAPVSALIRKGRVASQSQYPMTALLTSAVGQLWAEFAIRGVLVAAILALTQPPTLTGALGFLGIVLPLCLLFGGAGMILAVFAVAWRDIEKLLPIVLAYVFFLSHVLFTLPERVVPHWLAWCNPFAYAIDTARWYLMFGELPDPWLWTGWSLAGLVLFVKGLDFVAASEPLLAEHL